MPVIRDYPLENRIRLQSDFFDGLGNAAVVVAFLDREPTEELYWRGGAVRQVVSQVNLTATPHETDWERLNNLRLDLIEKEEVMPLSVQEAEELSQLQNLLYEKRRRESPLPIAQLKALQEELKREGLWTAP